MNEQQFEDKVEEWHNGAGYGLALHEYMGISWLQYCKYVEGDFGETKDEPNN